MSWAVFWLVSFAVAFSGFALISLVIAVRGVAEVRELFRVLEAERRPEPPPQEQPRTQ